MTTFDAREIAARVASPGGAVALVVLSSIVIFCAPQGLVAPLRTFQREVSRPGVEVALNGRNWASETATRWRVARAAGDELTASRSEVERLSRENEQLQTSLALVLGSGDRELVHGQISQDAPLAVTDGLRARVLGRQARAHLAQSAIIAGGTKAGVARGALVLDEPLVTLDRGNDAGVTAGQLAITGGRIWGRVVEVGPWISVVSRVNQPGYRDLVQLAQRDENGLRLGPRGVLEGNGEPLCRIRRVDTSSAVSPGDLVIAAGEQGLAATPLVYGRVERVEQAVGGAHWDIWMSPAAPRDAPEELTVVRTRLNAKRLAQGNDELQRK